MVSTLDMIRGLSLPASRRMQMRNELNAGLRHEVLISRDEDSWSRPSRKGFSAV